MTKTQLTRLEPVRCRLPANRRRRVGADWIRRLLFWGYSRPEPLHSAMEQLDGLLLLEMPGSPPGGAAAAPPAAEAPAADGAAAAPPAAEAPAADGAAPAAADTPQIDLNGLQLLEMPQTKRQKIEQRGGIHLRLLQDGRDKWRAKLNEQKQKEKAERKGEIVAAVSSLLPDAAKLVGSTKRTQVGRKKKIEPKDCAVLVRAVHMRAKKKIKVGVDVKKLIKTGARTVLNRQRRGVKRLLENSALLLRSPKGPSRRVHTNYCPIWDEVKGKCSWRPRKSWRKKKAALGVPTLVMRGIVSTTLMSQHGALAFQTREYWIAQPKELTGKKAKDLQPAIAQVGPDEFDFDSATAMTDIFQNVTSHTHMPMADEATSNVLLYKHWGRYWESVLLPLVDKCPGERKLLFWPDTCGIHKQHRTKLKVRGAKRHVMRAFGTAALLREQEVMISLTQRLELVAMSSRQERGDPPPGLS